jgi:D-alanyl-D-alanine carboxypeptidase/D-alanyl-D-alanine-endopeptidase (penicillin-binding protein 4)
VPVLAVVVLAGSAVTVASGSRDPARAARPASLIRLGFTHTQLSRRLARAVSGTAARRAREGAIAVDLATGRTVFSLNGSRPLEPASNEKLPLTYAALVHLGPGFRFHTDVLGSGRRDGPLWRGNLFLQGHGDPALHTSALVRLARTLHAEGIRGVTGRVFADESWFDRRRTAPGWKPSFYMAESAPLSALVVNRAVYGGEMTPDPAGAAAAIFTRVLDRHGVRVSHGSAWGRAPSDARLLARVRSQPLRAVLRFMDRWSDNFTAEMLLKTLGAQLTGYGTTAAGARVVIQTLARAHVSTAGLRIVDGSGLSSRDRLTVRSIAAVLVAARRTPWVRGPFFAALAVAGRRGTLTYRLRHTRAYGVVHGKTGTTESASALSGYARRRFAFAVVQNGSPVALGWAHRAQDRFATALS